MYPQSSFQGIWWGSLAGKVVTLHITLECLGLFNIAYCSIKADERKRCYTPIYKNYKYSSHSRVFYLVDMLFPTKKEIVLWPSSVSTSTASWIPSSYFHTCYFKLCWLQTYTDCWWTHCYLFPSTTAASSATEGKLELSRVFHHTEDRIECLLPESDDVQFEDYEVPWQFLGIPDVLIIMRQVKQEGRQEVVKMLKERGASVPCDLEPIQQSQPSSSYFEVAVQGKEIKG